MAMGRLPEAGHRGQIADQVLLEDPRLQLTLAPPRYPGRDLGLES